jgi:arylsulfatase A-like enzyme
MTHIDHQLNRLLEVLQEFGLRQTAYVCFTSDHGELMGDHHLFRKSLPYEGSARIPLLLSGPAHSGIKRGATPPQVVELRDVMPTLLDCAGLPIPDDLDGRSLLPLARGEQPGAGGGADEAPQRDRSEPGHDRWGTGGWGRSLHGEHTTFGQSVHWLTDGREKYVWLSGSGQEQLFDVEADPSELHDLARQAQHAGRVARWRGRMVETLEGRPEGFVSGGALVAGRTVEPVLPTLPSVPAPRRTAPVAASIRRGGSETNPKTG